MSTRRLVRLLTVFTFLAPCFAVACSANHDASEASLEAGSLELPLTSSVNGHTYRLGSGYLYVTGPTYLSIGLADYSQTLSLGLPTGDYTAYLYDATLQRDDGAGNFIPVMSTLVSSYAVPFRIYNGAKTTIAYEFDTDGVIVRVGSGILGVRVDVKEVPAVCTPFGSECGEGAWCPSSELTGMPRACVAAGPLAPGAPCAGPYDCAADSSCFDFGAGPVCARLCPASEFGSACSPDAECVPAGTDYGVCTPVIASGGGTGESGGAGAGGE